MKNRYTTNQVAGFFAVFDEVEKEDVFVTLKDGTHLDVARELNAGVDMESVILKYDVSNRT